VGKRRSGTGFFPPTKWKSKFHLRSGKAKVEKQWRSKGSGEATYEVEWRFSF